MEIFTKISPAFVLLWLCAAQAQDQPRLYGKTAIEWRQVYKENGYLTNLNSMATVTDQDAQVIKDLLQDDSRISTQLLDVIKKSNRNPETRSSNNLSRMVILLPSILKHTSSTNYCHKMQAISALESFGPYARNFAGDVAKLLNDDSVYIRAAAADTLSSLGDASVPFLGKLRDVCSQEKEVFAIKEMTEAISRIEKSRECMGDVSRQTDK